jgi:glycosyltransferase involved in cell wall biosynthesis
MKHILFITPLPPPVHGSAMVSQCIKDSELIRGEFNCDFVNLSTSRRMDEIGKGGAKKLLRFAGSFFLLFYKLLLHRYDLCYLAITCHGVGFLKDAPFVLLCKLFGRRIVIHQHNKGMSACIDRWPYSWLIPYIYKHARVILLSWHLYPDIAQAVKREQVMICPNGIRETVSGERSVLNGTDIKPSTQNPQQEHRDLTKHSTLNSKPYTLHSKPYTLNSKQEQRDLTKHYTLNSKHSTLNTKQELRSPLAVNLLFLSNLIPSKGVYVLLDACKMLKDRGVAFQCNFVGGESKEMDRRAFEEAVKERGLEGRVLYHGPKYGEEKEHYWSMADVFVQPTYEDCFPLTILEAMQHGLPVVSTDEGAVPDMVADGENGFVCRRKDAEGLAQALERLLQDEALRHRMGAEGYRIYQENFTLQCFERRFVECLRRGK